jgi:hypothetical protein
MATSLFLVTLASWLPGGSMGCVRLECCVCFWVVLLMAVVEKWPTIAAGACTGVSAALAAQTAFVCVLVFVVFFSLGSGPLPFLYMSEILSSEIKGKVRFLPNWQKAVW